MGDHATREARRFRETLDFRKNAPAIRVDNGFAFNFLPEASTSATILSASVRTAVTDFSRSDAGVKTLRSSASREFAHPLQQDSNQIASQKIGEISLWIQSISSRTVSAPLTRRSGSTRVRETLCS